MSTAQYDAAEERMNRAFEAARLASEEATKAGAECARLTLLKLAEQIDGLRGMSFESEYEYDDEGGYFRTVSVYPLFADGQEELVDPYEFSDEMSGFGADVIAVLCGQSEDAWEGQITIAEARERKF